MNVTSKDIKFPVVMVNNNKAFTIAPDEAKYILNVEYGFRLAANEEIFAHLIKKV